VWGAGQTGCFVGDFAEAVERGAMLTHRGEVTMNMVRGRHQGINWRTTSA
jgi:hypothetical protein